MIGASDSNQALNEWSKDLESIRQTLGTIEQTNAGEWDNVGSDVVEGVQTAVEGCGKICSRARDNLRSWNNHSRSGGVSRTDFNDIDFFASQPLEGVPEELQCGKLSLDHALDIRTLYMSIRNQGLRDETRRSVTSQSTGISALIGKADTHIKLLKTRLGQLDLTRDGGEDGSKTLDRKGAIAGLKERLDILQSDRGLMDKLLSRLQGDTIEKAAREVGSPINNISFGANNKGMQTGVSHGPITFNSGKHT
ncbi:Hypothetical protein D9617_51g088990 [Elsinoe fawcettii]|nr:Hypothetical protein D9617_51g088990 [Elsinoe fawcettii]